jgi:hypothetical protein
VKINPKNINSNHVTHGDTVYRIVRDGYVDLQTGEFYTYIDGPRVPVSVTYDIEESTVGNMSDGCPFRIGKEEYMKIHKSNGVHNAMRLRDGGLYNFSRGTRVERVRIEATVV